MLSSVLRSPLAIQVNIGIMRAFTEFRRMASSLALPNINADIAQLRKDFEDLKLDIEDILHDLIEKVGDFVDNGTTKAIYKKIGVMA